LASKKDVFTINEIDTKVHRMEFFQELINARS